VNNKDGFTSLLAVVAPNLLTKPATVMFNKVTIKGAKQACRCRTRAACGRVGGGRQRRGRRDPGGRGRQRLHLRRRVHPLGSGRRQENQEYNYKAVKESIARAKSRFAVGGRSRRQAQSGQASVRPLRARNHRERQTSGIRRSLAGWAGCSDCLERRGACSSSATLQRRDVGSRQAAVMQRDAARTPAIPPFLIL